MEHDKPPPTPLNELGRSFERQQKYDPARPYRWWELRPTPPEAPEVYYPRIETYEEGVARRAARKPPGFWAEVGAAIFLLVFVGGLCLLIGGTYLLALLLLDSL